MRYYKAISIKKIIKLALFVAVLLLLLVLSKQNFASVKHSVMLFLTSVLPSLFPFILFTEIILHTDIIDIISSALGPFFSKLFKVSKGASSAILIGFLCGFPMGSKSVSTLYEKGTISRDDANILLCFVNNCNPAFILSTIGIGVCYSLKIGVVLLISHLLSSILIGVFYARKYHRSIIHENGSFLNTLEKKHAISTQKVTKHAKNGNDFFIILKKSILNAFVTLANILGFIIIFNLLFSMVGLFLEQVGVNSSIIAVLSGIFEITSGAHTIFNSGMALQTSITIISFVLGVSGCCIICQIYATICEQGFKIVPLLVSKLVHGILSFVMTYLLLLGIEIETTTVNVFSSIDTTSQQASNYISTMKLSYFISLLAIILILTMYYFFHRSKMKRENKSTTLATKKNRPPFNDKNK